MNARSRVALIAVLSLAAAAIALASGQLTDQLMSVIRIPTTSYVSYDEIVAEMIGRVASLAVWLLPLVIFPSLRDIGSFRLTRTWTPLLFLPILGLNIYYFGRFPFPIPLLAHFALAFNGVVPAVVEELVFRGYAFRWLPESHPRLVVLTSTAAFTLIHLVNVSHSSLASVLATFPFVFAVGLSLGVTRMASGSLAWSMLAHGAVNASSALAMTGGTREKMLPFVAAIILTGAVMAFFFHPKFTVCSRE